MSLMVRVERSRDNASEVTRGRIESHGASGLG
jgi:hypothetical protein